MNGQSPEAREDVSAYADQEGGGAGGGGILETYKESGSRAYTAVLADFVRDVGW